MVFVSFGKDSSNRHPFVVLPLGVYAGSLLFSPSASRVSSDVFFRQAFQGPQVVAAQLCELKVWQLASFFLIVYFKELPFSGCEFSSSESSCYDTQYVIVPLSSRSLSTVSSALSVSAET